MEILILSKIFNVGNSKGIALPKEILKAYGWDRGDYVIFDTISDTTVSIKKVSDADVRKIKETGTITY